ncbi:MAG: TylF/MycF/NovP-related O-methyltransferase [Pseudomonadota bacterium]
MRNLVKVGKGTIKTLAERLGYKIIGLPQITSRYPDDLAYALNVPTAGYAPWLLDSDFRSVFNKVSDHTLLDEYRAYALWSLAGEAAKLPEGDVIEVGVWRGGSGCLLAKRFATLAPSAVVYLADTFSGVVKSSSVDRGYGDGAHSDATRQIVVDLAEGIDAHVEIMQGVFPDETGHAVAGNKFRFAHIDIDVYESAKAILDWLWPRLLHEAIVVFDDYGFVSCPGITHLVNDRRQKKDCIFIHNLTGQGILIKRTK